MGSLITDAVATGRSASRAMVRPVRTSLAYRATLPGKRAAMALNCCCSLPAASFSEAGLSAASADAESRSSARNIFFMEGPCLASVALETFLKDIPHELRLQLLGTELAANGHSAFGLRDGVVPGDEMELGSAGAVARRPHQPPAVALSFQNPAVRPSTADEHPRFVTLIGHRAWTPYL